MPAPRTHDPQQIKASFAGRPLDHGRDEGDFLQSEYLKELFTYHEGADGSGTRSKSASRAAKVTINCMSTSDTHRLLTTLYAQAQVAVNGDDIGAFEVVDLEGGMVESSASAWISKAPTNTHGAEVGKRAWELTCSELVRAVEELG